MKNISKLFALLLVVVMVLSMAAPAFAADEEKQTITVSYANAGHVYEAHQIFKGDLAENGKLTNIHWGEGVDGPGIVSALKAHKDLKADFANAGSAEDVAAILATYNENNENAKIEAFARVVAANLNENGNTSSAPVKDGDVYKYTIEVEGGDGYYIVMDAAEIAQGDAATKYILRVVGNVEVTAKAEAPTLEKKIQEGEDLVDVNNVSIGDKVNYVLTSKVPAMTEYNKYFFVINDTMSNGLTFNDDIVITIGGVALVEGTDYTVEVTENADGTTSFSIIFKNFIERKAQAGQEIKVTYSATLNEDANVGEEGNPNTANLVYSNNPNVEGEGTPETPDTPENPDKPGPNDDKIVGETPDDTVITYTSGLKLVKVDQDGKTLAGAKFVIEGTSVKVVIINRNIFVESAEGTYFRLTDGTYTEEVATKETEELYESTTVKYELVEEVVEETVTENVVTEAWVDANGVIEFVGLGAGEYTITELVAPEGYNMLTDPIEIKISFNAGATPKWTATQKVGEKDVALNLDGNLFTFNVVNKAGATLPTTGGMGTTLFYVVGAVLVLAAVVMLITKKRVANEG